MNRPHTHFPLFLVCLALSGLAAVSCSLTAPPPPSGAVATLAFATVPPSTGARFVPTGRPSAARGARIFRDNCTLCHGNAGRGDGEQAPFLNPKPPDFTSPEYMRVQRPDDYYQSVSKGVLGSAMIAWDGELTPDQIWDVVAYVWFLHTTDAQVAAGRQVYQAECAACHGQTGGGDGPRAAENSRPPTVLSAGRFLAGQAELQLFKATAGLEGVPNHDWTARLSEDRRWSVIAFLWTFLFERAGS